MVTRNMSRLHKSERQRWILAWLKEHFSADAVNAEFHDAYHKQFPIFPCNGANWGAQKVEQAMRDLREMANAGILDSGRIGLCGGSWQPGLPKWVVGYTLPKNPM